MTELSETKTEVREVEVVMEEKGLVAIDPVLAMVKDVDKPMFAAMSNVESLDWRNLPPNVMALILTQKPFMAAGGGTTYLNLRQAMIFALRAYELGVSPLSSEIWFDPNRGVASLTLEGRKAVARNRGIDLGPPQFEHLTRAWSEVPRLTEAAKEFQKLGFQHDLGVKCKIRVGPNGEHAEYAEFLCWLSEWGVHRSPVWKEKPQWMLSVRATDKCISMALGTGVSDPVDE